MGSNSLNNWEPGSISVYILTDQVLFSAQLIMGFGLPILIQDQSLTMGTVVKFLYSVPTNSSVYLDSAFNRERRNVPKTSRWDIYSMLEATCNRYTNPHKRRMNLGIYSFSTALIHCMCCMIHLWHKSLLGNIIDQFSLNKLKKYERL
jgi:hypothetical protein